MYNRKFDIKKDYSLLVNLECDVLPIVDKLEDAEERAKLREYIIKTFNNQWKR